MSDLLSRMAEAAAREWGMQLRAHCYRGINTLQSNDAITKARDGLLDFGAIRAARQRFDECLAGDALEVSRAIHRFPMMPEDLHEALFVRWVCPGKMDVKLATARRDRATFYNTLGRAHAFLAARLTLESSPAVLSRHESPQSV